jgi:hypothetical protein
MYRLDAVAGISATPTAFADTPIVAAFTRSMLMSMVG